MNKIIIEELDLDTFKNKSTLNPSLFDLENNKLKSDVREKLLDIAKDLYEDLKIDINYEDVWLIGSNANYNWSEYSDIDTHLIFDYELFNESKDIVENYFYAKKTLWNNEHEILIDGFEVELYIQNKREFQSKDGGIYSILFDRWIKEPEKIEVEINDREVEAHVQDVLSDLQDVYKTQNYNDLNNKLNNLSDKLYNLRKNSIKKSGEFGSGNIAFKYLRRLGLNNKIKKLKNHAYDISKGLSHGTTVGTYLDSKKQRHLSGNSNYADKLDKLTNYDLKKNKKRDLQYSDGIFYAIHGVVYPSLRVASDHTKEKKSTIQYRVHSKNPKYADYKIIYKK